MQAMEFPKGNYYMIICKAGDMALRITENDQSKYEKSQVSGTGPNPSDNGQIFMVEKIGLADDHFEIVNCVSALVFDEQSHQIRLKKGKQSKDQLFLLEKAPIQAFHTYYWIKTSDKGDKALHLEGILRYGNFDPNNQSFLFRFQQVNNYTIQNSSVIINNLSGKALDVPGATLKKGERLIQWEKNRRWNQRWLLQSHHGDKCIIKSVLNGLCCDIAGQSRDSGAKVVQWEQTGGTNQQWRLQNHGNGLFKIQSVHEGSLYLAIKKHSVDDGGQLEVSSDENPSMYWRIEGHQP